MKKLEIKKYIVNLVQNWYFPVGALAFYSLWYFEGIASRKGIAVALLLCAALAASTSSMWERLHRFRWPIKCLAALTSIGVFWDYQSIPIGGVSLAMKVELLYNRGLMAYGLPKICAELVVIAAWVFVFICMAVFWDRFWELLRDTGLLRGIPLYEWAAYGVILAVSVLFVTAVYANTGVFCGLFHDMDLIYTSDSAQIMYVGSYVNLFGSENDIRQPLFAVFAAPFTGLAYLAATPFYNHPALQGLIINIPQILLIFAGGFVLAKMLELSGWKRICFLLIFCCSNMYILFILMMEQYAVAFFWLILCVYLIWCRRPESMALWGAGGTLLTSMAWLPLMPKNDIRKDFRGWFRNCVKQGFGFLGVWLLFCRFDVLWGIVSRLNFLSQFAGGKLTLTDKLMQYISFVSACFLTPASVMNPAGSWEGHPAWHMAPVTSVNMIGLVLIVLVCLGLWLNREKRISWLCGYWIAFSAVILIGIGWGASENGLVLYALYFGWAFLVPLFLLVQRMTEKLKKPWLLVLFAAASVAALMAVNIPGTKAMLDFAVTYYPG